MKLLELQISLKTCKWVQREIFHKWMQQDSESFKDFVAELRMLAESWEFNNADEFLLGQVLLGMWIPLTLTRPLRGHMQLRLCESMSADYITQQKRRVACIIRTKVKPITQKTDCVVIGGHTMAAHQQWMKSLAGHGMRDINRDEPQNFVTTVRDSTVLQLVCIFKVPFLQKGWARRKGLHEQEIQQASGAKEGWTRFPFLSNITPTKE